MRDIDLAYGDAAEDFGGGGGREREFSMGAMDRSSAVDGSGGGDLGDFEVVDSGGCTDQIDDRVDRADFVKMNGLDGYAVKLGFGLGHAMKHSEGGITNRWS